MTRTAWIIVAIVCVMLLAGLAVVYRSSLSSMFASAPAAEPTPTPVATSTQPVWQQFATSTYSVQYPPGYTLNAHYTYDQFGPKKLIAGTAFTVPAQMATGTNLSSDTRVSVEQLPRAKACTGDIFIPTNVKATKMTDGAVNYSVASTSDAAAGNRYEEWVYALVGSNPCTAVRYFVHYGAIQNYPAGMVREFDRTQLLREFDQIRKSLTLK